MWVRSCAQHVEDESVEQIVISDRSMTRVLALLPAVAVALAIRMLTVTAPPLAVRMVAAAAVAVSGWVAYRLLTARVTVAEGGVTVRGVFYEADIPWSALESAEISPASRPLRLLVWGVMQPHSLTLRTGSRTLRPVAATSAPDDDDLNRAVGAIRARLGAWHIPAQRRPEKPADAAARSRAWRP